MQERGSLALTRMLVQSAIRVLAGGSLSMHDSSFSDTLAVSGTASLSGCTLAPSATIDLSGGGSLSLASMAVPLSALMSATSTLSGEGILRVEMLEVRGHADWGPLTGSAMADGAKPRGLFDMLPTFEVTSGPCTVSEAGRCVGRPEGYGPSEHCTITVGVASGVLAPCRVFDTESNFDYVTLPGDAEHGGSDCPAGVALAPGGAIVWTSEGGSQGSVTSYGDNGCAAKGTCGLPFSRDGLGGGWELCFA